MEMALNMGKFEELDQNEMCEVDGGLGPVTWCVIGFVGGVVVDGAVQSFTGKSCSDWVAEGINTVRSWF